MTGVHGYDISILRSVFTSNHSQKGQRENKMKISTQRNLKNLMNSYSFNFEFIAKVALWTIGSPKTCSYDQLIDLMRAVLNDEENDGEVINNYWRHVQG